MAWYGIFISIIEDCGDQEGSYYTAIIADRQKLYNNKVIEYNILRRHVHIILDTRNCRSETVDQNLGCIYCALNFCILCYYFLILLQFSTHAHTHTNWIGITSSMHKPIAYWRTAFSWSDSLLLFAANVPHPFTSALPA